MWCSGSTDRVLSVLPLHRQHAVALAQREQRRQRRHQRRKIGVRQLDALRVAGGAAGVDQRGHVVGLYREADAHRPLLAQLVVVDEADVRQQGRDTRLHLGVRHEHARSRSPLQVRRHVRVHGGVQRHDGGTRHQDAEERNGPRRVIRGGEQHAVTGLHAGGDQPRRRRTRLLTPFAETQARQAAVFGALERDRQLVAIGHLVQQGRQRLVRLGRFLRALQALVNLREYPLFEARGVNFQEPFAPVELFRRPRYARLLFGRKPGVGGAGVVAAKHVLELGDERQEHAQDVADVLLLARKAVDGVGGRLQNRRHRTERGLLQKARQRARALGDLVRADVFELLLREHGALEVRLQVAEHRATLAGALVVLALVQARELEEATHRAGVRVAGTQLIDGLVPPFEQLSQRQRETGRDHVARNHVQEILGAGDLQTTLADDVDERRAGVDALVPARKRVFVGRLDHRRPHDGDGQARGQRDLLADCLGVGVSVGKAPKLRAFHAEVGKLPLDELALHLHDFVLEHAAARRLTALVQVLLGFVQEVTLAEGVVGAMPRLLDHVHALGDLAIWIPVGLFELVGARKRKLARIGLGHVAGATAGHEAGAGVEQRQVAEVARQADQVGHAERVDFQGFVQRRIEIDDARDVDDHVHVSAQSVAQVRVQAAVRLDHVAGDGRHFRAQKLGKAEAVLTAKRVQHLTGGDLFVVALLRVLAALGPQGQVDVADVRVAAEQERPPHLAQKAGAADHDQALARQQPRELEARGRAVAALGERRFRSFYHLKNGSRSGRRAASRRPSRSAERAGR